MNALPLRPAAALLSRKALKHNLKAIRECIAENSRLHRADAEMMAVVKADAYGHDLQCVLPELEKNGIKFFAVASLAEGLEARKLSKKARILVLGGTLEWSLAAVRLAEKNRLEIAINDLRALKYFLNQTKLLIHLKLDTGMNRLGIKSNDWSEAIAMIRKSRRSLEGLFTHFATYDDPIFYRQVMLFEEAVRWFFSAGIFPNCIHSENSAALFSKNKIRKGILSEVTNLVRPGLAIYGYYNLGMTPAPKLKKKLTPVLELVSEVGLLKQIEKSEGVSYGHLYKSLKNHSIGIVPLGYADGLSKVYVKDLKPEWRSATDKKKGVLNICGAICMDMVMVRAQSGRLNTHDRVVFWGRFRNSLLENRIVEPYELNLRIAKRIPRIWVP